MTQSDLGWPLTKGFVSAVENGRCVPSLSAFVLLAGKLRITSEELLGAVNPDLATMYTAERAAGQSDDA